MSNPSHLCPQCGNALSETADRCSSCGSPVLPAGAELASPNESPALPPQFRGLKRPAPRYAVNPGCGLIIGILFSLCLTPFAFLLLVDEFRSYLRLAREGTLAIAVITDLEVESYDFFEEYYVHYEFRAPFAGDRKLFDGVDKVSEAYYNQLAVGQEIPIIYWPLDPEISAVELKLDVRLIIFALFFILLGPLTILFFSLYLRRLQRLRQRGQLVQGFIFDRWIDRDMEGEPAHMVAYAFEIDTPDRGRIIITASEQNERAYEKYQIGSPVVIRYLPENPRLCFLEEGSLQPPTGSAGQSVQSAT